MFAKTMMAAAAALMMSQAAMAQDKLIDSVSVDYGSASKQRMVRLSAASDWEKRWFQSNGKHLSGYWEGSVGYWRLSQYRDIPGLDKNLWDVGFTPVFRYQNDNKKGLYYEAGIGVHLLSTLYKNDGSELSTAFQFGDHVGIGYVMQNNWEVALKLQHFSNASIKRPNGGANFLELKAAYHF